MFILRLSCFGLTLAALSFVGCSDNHGGRMEVTGTVQLKGKPIKEGTVSFEPLEGQASRATAVIAGGGFSIPQESGLLPGKYLIRVSAGDGKTAVNPVNADNPPGPGRGTNIISKELVPADWNVKSKQEHTISKDGPNRIEFAIP